MINAYIITAGNLRVSFRLPSIGLDFTIEVEQV